eukprot:6607046-Prymnesium_polylepis.1
MVGLVASAIAGRAHHYVPKLATLQEREGGHSVPAICTPAHRGQTTASAHLGLGLLMGIGMT